MSEPILSVREVSHGFVVGRQRLEALRGVSFDVSPGEFVCIVGHSGCGKSTLLRLIAGLEQAEGGAIALDGVPVRAPSLKCGMVFQDHRLLPWLKVRDNVGFGLRHLSREERARAVDAHLELVGLSDFREAYPDQLSGGMQQRVSIARALAANPSLLLLDEPFSALDALTRARLQEDVLRIWRQEQTTMVMVTHDIQEAVYLGRRVIVMSQRPGTVKEILAIPEADARDRSSTAFAAWEGRLTRLLR